MMEEDTMANWITPTKLTPDQLEKAIMQLFPNTTCTRTPAGIICGLKENGIACDQEELGGPLSSLFHKRILALYILRGARPGEINIHRTEESLNAEYAQQHTCYEGCDHLGSDFP